MKTMQYVESILLQAFEPVEINCGLLECRDVQNKLRVETEFAVADLCLRTWPQITIAQALGTWDVVPLLSNGTLRAVLPGYIKHLADTSNADTLLTDVPSFLLNDSNFITFITQNQIISLHKVFILLIRRNREALDEKEVNIYVKLTSKLAGHIID